VLKGETEEVGLRMGAESKKEKKKNPTLKRKNAKSGTGALDQRGGVNVPEIWKLHGKTTPF